MASLRAAATRRSTNVTLDPRALADARELGINVSQACERGLVSEIKKTREAKWLKDNRDAIEATNAFVAEHGLPLAKYRVF